MRTRIKVCGLTREQDVDAAVEAGTDALGFVFYEQSPRAVSVAQARLLIRRLPAWVSAVGLFVNAPRDQILATADQAGISHIQMHGDESPEDCLGLGRPVIKAIRIRGRQATGQSGQSDAAEAQNAAAESQRIQDQVERYAECHAVLFDADSAGFGGSGQAFDWGLLERVVAKAPGFMPTWVLSGGLESGSVGRAIQALRPPCVDVSSGVELLQQGKPVKGIKDARRINEFIAAVQAADQKKLA